ncbi:MAG: DUF4445 domain-containing protein [Clostridia bacterium]|nr:DUF4445 domain-containing protein [Clostridia bacterium]
MIIEIAPENGEKNLLELIRKKGYNLSAPCGGNGHCGRCKVLLNGKEVLACRTEIDGPCVAELPDASGILSETGISEQKSLAGKAPFFAVDIGTTTVAVALCEGTSVAETITFDNPQIAFGADVLTRIQKANELGVEALQKPLFIALKKNLDLLAEKYDVFPKKMYLCGNTVMLHIFWGESVATLGVAPYAPVFSDERTGATPEFGDIEAITLPCLSSYVGADIFAGIIYCPPPSKNKIDLLIDLGTNAEIALLENDRILTASAAAGPCFEAGNISCGMPATDGAITSFSFDKTPRYTFLGTRPTGLCGTGLIDVIGQLRKNNAIDKIGFLKFNFGYPIAPSITLTQNDVRQFQLAKSAVRSGVEVLLKKAGRNYGDVEKVYLAGGVSAGIDVDNAACAGLIPKELSDKCVSVKNSALAGTILYASSPKKFFNVKEQSTYIDLATSPLFAEAFIKNIDFE